MYERLRLQKEWHALRKLITSQRSRTSKLSAAAILASFYPFYHWITDLENECDDAATLSTKGVLDKTAIGRLQEQGYCIVPNALQNKELTQAVQAARRFELATTAAWVRRDEIGWVDENNQGQLKTARTLVRGVGAELDTAPEYKRSTRHRVPTECQLGRYESGGFYGVHRDNRNDATLWEQGLVPYLVRTPERRRCCTAILYLTHDDTERPWSSSEDGGELVLYLGTEGEGSSKEGATATVRVEPRGGTLLVFDSSLLHEVRQTRRPKRNALTSWVQGAR